MRARKEVRVRDRTNRWRAIALGFHDGVSMQQLPLEVSLGHVREELFETRADGGRLSRRLGRRNRGRVFGRVSRRIARRFPSRRREASLAKTVQTRTSRRGRCRVFLPGG